MKHPPTGGKISPAVDAPIRFEFREKTLSIRTIVAALALETDGDPVAGRAVQLARWHEARLIFVHVVADAIPGGGLSGSPDVAAVSKLMVQEATDRIRQLTGNSGSGVAVEIVVDAGKPFRIIDEVARREGADLVVIGPGKAKNIREKVFGSTADRVVRTARQPVLVVRSTTPDPYCRLAVAMDFSAASQAAAEAALSLAPGTDVAFVHAIEIPLGFEQAMLKAGTSQAEIERYRRARAHDARRQIGTALKKFDLPVARPKIQIVHGAAGPALVRLSRSGRTDLVALGTHGGNAISQALMGSVARHVLRAAGCDVLVSA